MISPHFVCLSMIVSGAPWRREPMPLSARDCFAYAIEREAEMSVADMPPLVQRSVALFLLQEGSK